MKRICTLAILPLVSTLAACGSPGFDDNFSARQQRSASPLSPVVVSSIGTGTSREDFADAIMLLPPEAGAVTRIRERHYPNGTRQDIIMAGGAAGDNVIEVSVRTQDSVGRSMGGQLLQIGEPSERGVRNEIMSRFPDVRMHIVTRPIRNTFGPVGVAVGRRADGARCVFGWQWIADAREAWPNQSNLNRMGALFSSRSAADLRAHSPLPHGWDGRSAGRDGRRPASGRGSGAWPPAPDGQARLCGRRGFVARRRRLVHCDRRPDSGRRVSGGSHWRRCARCSPRPGSAYGVHAGTAGGPKSGAKARSQDASRGAPQTKASQSPNRLPQSCVQSCAEVGREATDSDPQSGY